MDETNTSANTSAPEATPKAGGSKKIIWILVAIIIILGVAGFFYNKQSVPTDTDTTGGQTEEDVQTVQNPDGSVTYSNSQGSVTVNGGGMPSNWSSDAPPAYEDAAFLYSATNNASSGAEASAIVYTTGATVAEMIAYYLSGLETNGWTIESEAEVEEMMVITARKDTRLFAAYIGEEEGVVQVTSGIEFNAPANPSVPTTPSVPVVQ